MLSERRQTPRLPVGFYLSQVVDDHPERCFTTSLSSSGLYMERVLTPPWRGAPATGGSRDPAAGSGDPAAGSGDPAAGHQRTRDTVQVEIPLPGAPEPIWARARVVYDCFDSLFHGTAVRFTAMPHGHRRLLREWLRERFAGTSTGQVVFAAPGISIFRPPPIRY